MGQDRRQRRRRLAALGGAAVAAKKQWDKKSDAEQQDSAPQAEPTDPAPAASGGVSADTTERLKELGQLHEQGVLTDEEFASEKAKVLGT
jgi:Short C-terminal domain